MHPRGDFDLTLASSFSLRAGLAGKFQASNASLAVALVLYWLEQRKNGVGRSSYRPAPITKGPLDLAQDGLPSFVRDGLESARWPGRAQLIDRGASCPRLYLDGAHTEESLLVAKEWFLEATAALERQVNSGRYIVFSTI
jgi:folylpolyglutamate synthase/dihydropteroate synthase